MIPVSTIDMVTNLHRPRLPVVPLDDDVSLSTSGSLAVEVTPESDGGQGSARVQNALVGFLFLDGRTPVVRVSTLEDDGRPRPLHPLLATVEVNNPQLMPMPARIRYEFESGAPDLEADIRETLESVVDGILDIGSYLNDVLHRDETVPGTVDVEIGSIDDAVDAILDGSVGLPILAGWKFGELDVGETVTISVEDYRNYTAVDQPLAVVENSSALPTDPNDVVAVNRPGECRGSSDDYATVDDAEDLTFNRTNGNYTISSVGDDAVAAEERVVVHYNQSDGTHHDVFDLDVFEKWARFPAALEWHLRNWYVSGLLRRRDRDGALIEELVEHIYPAGRTNAIAPADTATNGAIDNVVPPTDIVRNVEDGEEAGEQRPIYDFAVEELHWRVERHNDDTFSAANHRGFTEFDYHGASDIEEYVKRVAVHEYAVTARFVDESDSTSASDADRVDREKEGLKAQMNAARTYLLSNWFAGNRGMTNPFATDPNYQRADVNETASFHVHIIQTLNEMVRNSPDVRVVIEEAIAETWGQVLTYQGRFIDAEFYAGDDGETEGCPGGPTYKQAVKTSYGADCAQFQFSHSDGEIDEVEVRAGGTTIRGTNTNWDANLVDRELRVTFDGETRYFEITGRNSQTELEAEPLRNSDDPGTGTYNLGGEDYVIRDYEYRWSVGHGRGQSQMGSKVLSSVGWDNDNTADQGLSYLQIGHWHYYGVEIRNAFGQGDVITETPNANDWVAANNPPNVPEDEVAVTNGRWQYDRVISDSDDENWYIGQNFQASEYCTRIDGQNTELDVAVSVVQALQRIRFGTDEAVNLAGLLTEQDDDGNTVADPDAVQFSTSSQHDLKDVRNMVTDYDVGVDIPGGGGDESTAYNQFVARRGE